MSPTQLQVDLDIPEPPADSQTPAKKQTRKWAAWTRQEEENFFNALRQAGKNFIKITDRVQSKNKDQVRHYYYRLVRRMNKLLSPEFSLDATNSKDTVAAMLRWWTLLEKFGCTASKLHLKPRRFKTFIETLENQLLKDRNKTRRKRCSQGESCVDTTSTNLLTSSAPVSNTSPVKPLPEDSQNAHKIRGGKGTSSKHNTAQNVSSNKVDLPTTKTVRQKRRGVTSAAYKKWEKDAMAGVSLMADAAEQMERATNDGPRDTGSTGKTALTVASPEVAFSNQIRETTLQSSTKLQLQLFPIDEAIRKTLQKDGHNPHLELTLSARKRISSVLEHLNRKWGKSIMGMGELMLLPYSSQQEDNTGQRWTARDTDASTADVYSSLSSPSIFRLRYGCFSSADVGLAGVHVENQIQHKLTSEENATGVLSMEHARPANDISDTETSKNLSISEALLQSAAEPMFGGSDDPQDGSENANVEIASSCLEITADRNCMTQPQDMVNLESRNLTTLSAGDWADSLTTISVGDLLSEASRAAECVYTNSSAGRELEQIPFSCDSFDAAIAAHVTANQLPTLATELSHASIWNAEETCDGFSFQKVPAFQETSSCPMDTSTGGCRQDIPESRTAEKNTCTIDNYWPDSLGPFEEMPSTRYRGDDLIFGDSISFGGLSRLIASSVDAFQNCSFLAMDKKDISTGEACGVSVLSGNKTGSEE